jgi:hypothetical protein
MKSTQSRIWEELNLKQGYTISDLILTLSKMGMEIESIKI